MSNLPKVTQLENGPSAFTLPTAISSSWRGGAATGRAGVVEALMVRWGGNEGDLRSSLFPSVALFPFSPPSVPCAKPVDHRGTTPPAQF